MLTEHTKKTKTSISQQRLNDFKDYMIKVDYFDKKGLFYNFTKKPITHLSYFNI